MIKKRGPFLVDGDEHMTFTAAVKEASDSVSHSTEKVAIVHKKSNKVVCWVWYNGGNRPFLQDP